MSNVSLNACKLLRKGRELGRTAISAGERGQVAGNLGLKMEGLWYEGGISVASDDGIVRGEIGL